MPRKQVGAIDAELLAEVDKRAEWLGQTRRVFIERTLHHSNLDDRYVHIENFAI